MIEKQKFPVLRNILLGPVIIVLTICIGFFFKYTNIPETNIAIIHLLAVVAISIFTQQYFMSVMYSVRTTLVFNYFFTAPYMALEIDSVSYIITFSVMVTVSMIITMLTQSIKKNALMANQRAEENSRLYSITSEVAAAQSINEIMDICARDISEICRLDIICLYRNIMLSNTAYTQHKYLKGEADTDFACQLTEADNFETAVEIYKKDVYLRKWEVVCNGTLVAMFMIPRIQASNMDMSSQRMFMMALESITMVVERMQASEKQAQLIQENERERYRSNLLRAISHDLRTPLSGIMGTSEMIMGMTDSADPRFELAYDIMKDADWLHSLMENILNLTRLEDNRYNLKKQPEAVEEIIAVVLERFEKRSQGREVVVNIPDELILVPVDAKLIVQVLINLLDNSVKHTTQQQKIYISVEKQGGNACFMVRDEGTGISRKDLPYIFQMYYTTSLISPDAQKGMGLGLAICDAVIKAHGGTIKAENHPDGGAVFTFTIPMEAYAYEQL